MKHKRKRRFQITIMYIIILFLLVVVGLLTAHFIKEHFKNKVIGTWERKLDLSEAVKASVNDWLDDNEEIDFYFTPVVIRLSFEKDGTYKMSVDEESYNSYINDAHRYVNERFASIVESNLLMAGYSGDDISTVSKELISETIDGELGVFLEENGVIFTKPMEFFGEYISEGTYEFKRKEGIIVLNGNSSGEQKLTVNLSEDVIVFTGNLDGEGSDLTKYPITYTKVIEE